MLTKQVLRLSQPLSRCGNAVLTSQQMQVQQLQQQSRAISSTFAHRAGHESHYNAPGGWLWGERPGEKYEKEGWENLFYWGFCGSWVVAIIAYTMKEDSSIQTWALEEARRRLEAEGILEDTAGK